MKILRCLLCVGALVGAIRLPAQGEDFLSESVLKWERATAYTLEVARALPRSEYGFRAAPEEMTFGQQLDHMAQNMTWLAGDHLAATKFAHPLAAKKDRTPEETIDVLTAALAYARDAIATTKAADLGQKGKFFAGPMSKRQIVALMHDHHTHHRGQLIVYLRLKGIKPPPYRGW
ncbi:MAG: DinB family protein [Opitutus sp.]|nr:DinB family protein [Opitutus sp.]